MADRLRANWQYPTITGTPEEQPGWRVGDLERRLAEAEQAAYQRAGAGGLPLGEEIKQRIVAADPEVNRLRGILEGARQVYQQAGTVTQQAQTYRAPLEQDIQTTMRPELEASLRAMFSAKGISGPAAEAYLSRKMSQMTLPSDFMDIGQLQSERGRLEGALGMGVGTAQTAVQQAPMPSFAPNLMPEQSMYRGGGYGTQRPMYQGEQPTIGMDYGTR